MSRRKTKTLQYNACKQSVAALNIIVNAAARAMNAELCYLGTGKIPDKTIKEFRHLLEPAYGEISLILNRLTEPAKRIGEVIKSQELFGLRVEMAFGERRMTLTVIHHPLGKFYPQPYRIEVFGYGGASLPEQQGMVTTEQRDKFVREI